MDMSSMNTGMDNSTMAMQMATAFSTTLGSANLWFVDWTPTTSAATFGASLGLFFLALFSRLLGAVRSSCEHAWRQSVALRRAAAQLPPMNSSDTSLDSLAKDVTAGQARSPIVELATKPLIHYQHAPPFIPAIDIPRSLLFMFQAFVGYLMMLAIMTFDAWFFIAIILGLGVGELAFGRLASHSGGGGGDGLHW